MHTGAALPATAKHAFLCQCLTGCAEPQVNNARTTSGSFFGLTRPGQGRQEEVEDLIGRGEETDASTAVTLTHSGYVGSRTCTAAERASRPWLMAHQTGELQSGLCVARSAAKRTSSRGPRSGDRKAGKVAAKHISCSRTPLGGFATFDLAKAPK